MLDPKAGFKVAYHGPLDERFAKGSPNLKAAAKDAYAAKAIDAVLAGKPVANPRVDVKTGKTIALPGARQGRRARQHLLLEGQSRRSSRPSASPATRKAASPPSR